MDDGIARVFDQLQRRRDWLEENSNADNEANRHDQLVLPLLSNPLVLGWDYKDLRPQHSIPVPPEVKESYIFRNAIPRKRRPDVLIFPSSVDEPVAVVEEKGRQETTEKLSGHRGQLAEYLSLWRCVWGVLTDGNRWIVQRQFESHLCFESLEEVRRHLSDFREAIGKRALLERLRSFGTPDIVFLAPPRAATGLLAGATPSSVELLEDLLRKLSELDTSIEVVDRRRRGQREYEMELVRASKRYAGGQDDPMETAYLEAADVHSSTHEELELKQLFTQRDQLRRECRASAAHMLREFDLLPLDSGQQLD